MKEIVIISGKGGTGKTSITACFAHLADRTVLADCDVDAADLHLLLEPKTKESGEFKAGRVAIIDKKNCTLCGECSIRCRFGAIKTKDDFYYVDNISCEGCKVCEIVCPSNAIRLEEKISGDWYIANSKKHPFIYAYLRPGEENSGKLVSLVRSKARDYAKDNNIEMIIIDGPPGIGCPVIASVGGVNLALIVTEPTQSGLHDLKRIFELTEHFKIATCICINKFDLNLDVTKDIEKFCMAKNVNVVGRIPYDVSVTKAMLQGLSIVEYAETPVSEEIRRMWKRLCNY
ncbi:MAG: 4Fe-4S binding protein [Pseudomonadota bacterium]